jgi:hypothetical protein
VARFFHFEKSIFSVTGSVQPAVWSNALAIFGFSFKRQHLTCLRKPRYEPSKLLWTFYVTLAARVDIGEPSHWRGGRPGKPTQHDLNCPGAKHAAAS